MPDNGSRIAWGQIFITFASTVIAGVAVGIVLYQYSTQTPDLVYETFPPTDFSSQTTQLSIYNARVENVGDKEAEDVQVRFELSAAATINAFQVEPSLRSISYKVVPPAQRNVREVDFARLNPGESSRFSMLSDKSQSAPILIEVRAKGITGHSQPNRSSEDWMIAKLVPAIAVSFLSFITIILGAYFIGDRRVVDLVTSHKRVVDQELRLVRTREKLPEDMVENILRSTRYRLFFNPSVPGLSKSKIMRFGPKGEILEGSNNNENTWRIRHGLLELVDSTGGVHSRFYYSPDDERFFHTNDPDTGSIQKHNIRDQYMVPES